MNHAPAQCSQGPVEQVLGLLEQALTILDKQGLPLAAAKVDEARWAVHRASGNVACLSRRR